MESKLAMAKLVLNFKLKLAPGFEEIKITKAPGVLRFEKNEMKLILEELNWF